MNVLEHLEPKSVFRFFEEMCAIPHGSRNTKARQRLVRGLRPGPGTGVPPGRGQQYHHHQGGRAPAMRPRPR